MEKKNIKVSTPGLLGNAATTGPSCTTTTLSCSRGSSPARRAARSRLLYWEQWCTVPARWRLVARGRPGRGRWRTWGSPQLSHTQGTDYYALAYTVLLTAAGRQPCITTWWRIATGHSTVTTTSCALTRNKRI